VGRVRPTSPCSLATVNGCLGSNFPVTGRGPESLESLRVFGRLPGTDPIRDSEAGVRKASKEETAGDYAPAAVSVYGDLRRGSERLGRSRTELPA
jgi:hypothetical protein